MSNLAPFDGPHLVTDGVICMHEIDDVRAAIKIHEQRLELLREQLAWLEDTANRS